MHKMLSETLLSVAIGSAAMGFRFIAQVTTIPGVETFANVTAMGLVAFFVWYTLTKTIPEMHKTFREEQTESRRVFKETIDKLMERE